MNRLAGEASPYLRQHAENPVDWFPWGSEAFTAASELDRPILLSVGYSACHWCHVMAHESFENAEIAAQMNDGFVNVKVDREERPDVDAIYMDAVTSLTGRGGWPMTVFCTPDGRPFHAGTYWPDTPRGGMASFPQVLSAIVKAWAEDRQDLDGMADRLTAAMTLQAEMEPAAAPPGPETLAGASDQMLAVHDDEWGGLGGAPKFPQAMNLEALLRNIAHTGKPEPTRVLTTTLDAMASGGMYDHLGGGFARYSTDEKWLLLPVLG